MTDERSVSAAKEAREFEAAVDQHALVAITDGEGRICQVNDLFCSVSQYSRLELLGRNLRIVNSGFHPPEFFRDLWSTISSGRVWRGDIRNRAKTGSFYWVGVTIVPFDSGSGRPEKYIAIQTSLPQRRVDEQAWRDTENLFAKSFRFSPDYVLIVRASDRVIVQINDALCHLWRCDSAAAGGRPISTYIEWLNPGGSGTFLEWTGGSDESHDFEGQFRLSDNRLIDLSISSRLVSFKGESCLLIVMRDITERRRAEIAAAQLAAIVESSDDAIVGKNLNGVITSWNTGAEAVFGYTSAEMVGNSIMRLIPADRQQEELDIIGRIRRGEPVRHFETVRVRKDGSLIDVSVTVSPIRGASGVIVGASKVARNITSRKKAEAEIKRLNLELERRVSERTAELESANRELEAFSYSVSHDLRAPLRAVDGFSQAVLDDYASLLPPQGQRYLRTVRSSAQHMGALIDDLLQIARLSRHGLRKKSISTDELVREILDEQAAVAKERNVQIEIGPLPPSMGDPVLLRQVWGNLLSNALKYTRLQTAPRVDIGFVDTDGVVAYFVRDNGTGFDMRYADRLFGVFQRLHRSEDFEGTGVGLAIVKRIVERHGGKVWADAKLDEGATFFFTLGPSNQT